VIPGNWTKNEQAVLRALKKVRAIVADNGNFLDLVAPDQRFSDDDSITSNRFPSATLTVIPNDRTKTKGRVRLARCGRCWPDQTIAIGATAIRTVGSVHRSAASSKWQLDSGPAR